MTASGGLPPAGPQGQEPLYDRRRRAGERDRRDRRRWGGARASALASAKPKVLVDTAAADPGQSGKVEAKVGNVVLGDRRWTGSCRRARGRSRTPPETRPKFDTGKFHIALLGLEVLGYTVPEIDGKEKVEIPINLELPAPFDSVLGEQATGSATLQATSGAA